MSFCDIRITTDKILGEDASGNIEKHRDYSFGFLYANTAKWEADDYIMGEEVQNKFGEPTHRHYHINFYTEKEIKKDTVQKWIRNTYNLKGNAQYCVRVHIDLEDRNRWWRYPMKEKLIIKSKNLDDVLLNGVTAKDLKLLARDERKRQIEQNVKSRQNLLDKNAFRDKMFAYFKDEYKGNIPSDKVIWCQMSMYYIQRSKTPPRS